MNDRDKQAWGERLAAESAAATDETTMRRLFGDAVGIVKGRLGEVSRGGIRPLLDDGKDVFAYFRHEDAPTAPRYAERLLTLLGT